jgi:predicted lipoprotein
MTMRALLTVLPLLLLAACSDEPENIQAKADNVSRQLEDSANRIEAEAAANAAAAAAPLDNEAEALLNQAAANAAEPIEADATGNAN